LTVNVRAWFSSLWPPAAPPVVPPPEPLEDLEIRVSADFSRRTVRYDVGSMCHFTLSPPVAVGLSKQTMMAVGALGPEPEPEAEPVAVELEQVDVVLVDAEEKERRDG